MTTSAIVSCQHTTRFMDTPVYFQLLKLPDSAMLWVSSTPVLTNMSLAIPSSNTAQGAAFATTVLGDTSEDFACQLGRRLVQRFRTPFYVSWELPTDTDITVYAERILLTWLKETLASK
ncbi:hypothetical protein BDF22DRAFT_746934 [Syncephalis plumigaleata]|nr:hypothetical protein BDF22DRAFT_746934 [Syncephalis plumigaleata]